MTLALALVVNLASPFALTGEIAPEELAKVKAAEAARIKVVEKVYGSVVAIYPKSRPPSASTPKPKARATAFSRS